MSPLPWLPQSQLELPSSKFPTSSEYLSSSFPLPWNTSPHSSGLRTIEIICFAHDSRGWLGTGREYWLGVSWGCSYRVLTGSSSQRCLCSQVQRWGLQSHTAGGWNSWAPRATCLLCHFSIWLLCMAAAGSWTSSVVAEGSWCRCPKTDWHNLALKVTITFAALYSKAYWLRRSFIDRAYWLEECHRIGGLVLFFFF